ncbi:MFS transporter (plasmid) [Arthrobacter sp. G.S.26]|uniref:MFS transporter n=1 Tax=Arthrobacter sp. G.S.26 TaxID=3433706 RepID=UPI003D7863C9
MDDSLRAASANDIIEPLTSVVTPTSSPASAGATGVAVPEFMDSAPMKGMGRGGIALLVLAFAGVYTAFVTPQAFSLAVRVSQLDPTGQNAALAIAIGVPSVFSLLTSPIANVLSDRTRSRFGRRRPWLALGAVLALVGSAAAAFAPTVPILIAVWTIGFVGYALCAGMILAHMGDRLAPGQRGRVSGITGAVTQVAPIIGITLAGTFSASPIAMFLVPATIAFAATGIFVLVMRDDMLQVKPDRLDLRTFARGFYFDPRQLPDLGWVVTSRALLFTAVGFLSVYTVYFLIARFGLDAAGSAALISLSGLIGVGAAIFGALVCGWASDKLKVRKPFLVGTALVLAGSLFLTASATSTTMFIVSGVLTTFAVGAYGAVDQATALDVIPHAEGQNARYLGLVGLSNGIPQALAPFAAGAVVAMAVGDYASVYIVGGIAAVLGAVAILPLNLKRAAAMNGR